MENLLTLLLISNITIASNLDNQETDEMLIESIALSHHLKIFSQNKIRLDFITVGADIACGYSSIQAAINDFFQSPLGNIDIRIASNKTYFENIVIGDSNISLSGGYSNCSDANVGNQTTNQALINANNNGTVLTIQGVNTRRTMAFTNLRLINGNNATGAGGGLVSDNSKVLLLLENVDIRNNSARNGAGIAIVGGDTDLLMNETLILGNLADYGGGIYCSGGASSVNVANNSGVIANFANSTSTTLPNGQGGGAYIDGCYFAIFTGSPNNGSFTGMSGNSSVVEGGAIFAINATIRLHGHQSCGSLGCLGDDTNPVSFRSNQSNQSPGAVLYAENTDVRINATWMEGNVGDSLIYLLRSGLLLERFNQSCWRNSECNLIENNNTRTIIERIKGSDSFEISNTTFRNNTNNLRLLHVINYSSIRMPVKIESNIFYNNGSSQARDLFNLLGSIDASFIHNTIIDNNSMGSVWDVDWIVSVSTAVAPFFEAHSNIIDNPGVPLLVHSTLSSADGVTTVDVNISALITNEVNSLSVSSGVINDAVNFAGGDFITQTILGEVLFVDRANGDLHLSSNSRAIDYFNTPVRATVTYKDIDYEDRGVDDPNNQSAISNLFYYDIGADEKIEKPEIIFINGFE